MQGIKACIFDYGGTLIDESEFNCYNGMDNVLKYVSNNPFSVTVRQMTEMSNEMDKKMGRKKGHIEHFGDIEYPQSILLQYIFDYYKLEFTHPLHEVEYAFWSGATNAYPIEDAHYMLKTLQKNEIEVGIISNINFSEYALSKRIQLAFPDIIFKFIISSATIGFRKPNQAIFDLGQRMMEIKKEEIFYIGDRIDKDVVGALNYGMQAGYFSNFEALEQNELSYLQINNWKELIEYLNLK